MAPKMPGKVRPAGTSYSPSAAEASTSVTPSVGSEVIFSTPPTRTTSYMPLAMAITPSRRALPLLAQAFSTRVIGVGVIPSQSAMMGAVCPWCSNRSAE